jgi:hypothetical protein
MATELGRAINEAGELRLDGAYGPGTPDATKVAAYVAKAEHFIGERIALGVMHGFRR